MSVSVSLSVQLRCDGVLLIWERINKWNCRNVQAYLRSCNANKSSGAIETDPFGNGIKLKRDRQLWNSSSCSLSATNIKRGENIIIKLLCTYVRTHTVRQRDGTSIVNKYNVIYRSYLVTQTYFTMCTERRIFFCSIAVVSPLIRFHVLIRDFFSLVSVALVRALSCFMCNTKIRLTCIFTLYDWLVRLHRIFTAAKMHTITRLQHENDFEVCSCQQNVVNKKANYNTTSTGNSWNITFSWTRCCRK